MVAIVTGGVPWTVITIRGPDERYLEFVFGWGLVATEPFHLVTLVDYLFELTAGLPDRLLAWPIATLLYLTAVGSLVLGAATGREDRRFTAGMFALAGVSLITFALGIARRNPQVVAVVPVGSVVFLVLAWWSWPVRLSGDGVLSHR